MSAKRARKKRSGNPKGSPQNLVRGSIRTPRTLTTAQEDQFCLHFKFCGSAKKAALLAGYHPSYSTYLLRQPRILERLAELDKENLQLAITEFRRQYEIDTAFVDEELAYFLKSRKTHKYRGDADFVKGCETAYKRLNLIRSAHVTMAQQQNSLAPASKDAFDVYKSAWLVEREQGWAKQLEGNGHVDPDTEE